jgi:hypothetical protein
MLSHQPLAQQPSRATPERSHALLAALAPNVNRSAAVEVDIVHAQPNDFRDAGTSIVERVQHDVVTLATPCRSIWCLKDSLHLFVRQETEEGSVESFHWNGKDPLDRRECRRVTVGGIAKK